MNSLATNVEQINGHTYIKFYNINYSSSDTENPATEFPPPVAELPRTPSLELCPSDSDSDLSDLGSPVPEANMDVVKRRGSLSESEKYKQPLQS